MQSLESLLPTAIVLFAGVGGSSLGLLMAGYRELLAVEYDKIAIKNFQLNLGTPVWEMDIYELTANLLMSRALLYGKLALDLLVITAPCQGFSEAAGKTDPLDPRNGLFLKSIDLIEGVTPKVFLIENVPGMFSDNMTSIMNEIKRRFTEQLTEYIIFAYKVNCLHFEVPTSRERIIFIGIHKSIFFAAPEIIPVTTDFDALRIGSIAPEVKQLRVGQSKKTSKFPDDFLTTITATEGIFVFVDGEWQPFSHFDHLMLKFSTFPADFKLEGTPAQKHKLIGNAVPPMLMYYLAKYIKEQILIPAMQLPSTNMLALQ